MDLRALTISFHSDDKIKKKKDQEKKNPEIKANEKYEIQIL